MFGRTEEPSLSILERTKLFLVAHWRGVITVFGPILLVPILLPLPAQQWQWAAYTMALMTIFWISECIPLPITGFIPVITFPMSGVMSTSQICKCYFNDTVMMFLGSILLAYSIEQSGLHRRVAYNAIKLFGYSHYKILLTLCIITTFVSMWVTNTAAVTMMVPIIFSLLKVYENQGLLKIYNKNSNGENVASDITVCYFCAATFSATIGGIGTLIGTATNLVFKGLFTETFPDADELITFPKFSMFAIPLMIVLELLLYIYLCIVYLGLFRSDSEAAKSSKVPVYAKDAAKKAIINDLKEMGSISFREIMVIILFGAAMALLFCRSPKVFSGWGDKIKDHFEKKDDKFVLDSALAMLIAFLMCLLPSTLALFKNCTAKFHENLPKSPVASVLNWKLVNANMPSSFIFLIGGGFALAKAASTSGLLDKLGGYFQSLKAVPNIAMLLFIIVFTCFETNFVSNVAVCNILVPIVMQLAKEMGQNPLWYNIAVGYTSSFCFMFPLGTPGNKLVQNVAKIETKKMIIAGAGPTVTSIILTWLLVFFWAPIVWPGLKTQPDWAKKAAPAEILRML